MVAQVARVALVALVAVTLVPQSAWANGRFPTAQFFSVGSGSARDHIAVSTTFGLLVSHDAGATWGWICEEALGFSGEYDPITAITSTGALVTALPDGASLSRGDWCDFASIDLGGTDAVGDVAAEQTRVLAVTRTALGGTRVYVSNDDARSFARRWSEMSVSVVTADLAASADEHVMLSGNVMFVRSAVFASEDQGRTFEQRFDGFSAETALPFIAMVDPLSAQRSLVRTLRIDGESELYRSDDGGRTMRALLRRTDAIVGATAMPGMGTLWAMSSEMGARLQRSDDGGMTWSSTASTLRARSLRYRDGVLFGAFTESEVGLSFGCSVDGGESFRTQLRVRDVRGPERCAEGSTVRRLCAPLWPSLSAQLQRIVGPMPPPTGVCAWDVNTADAGPVSDASGEVSVDVNELDAAMDAPRMDVTSAAQRDAMPSDQAQDSAREPAVHVAGGGCQCDGVKGGIEAPSQRSLGVLVLILLALQFKRARGAIRGFRLV